ncbi:DUF3048 domain-containing protein, partial [Candidatus Uhrbacteria bacterium]|nr:DUF3048 domain-containing protein [Candidatus Uhrbacteria bacterium]
MKKKIKRLIDRARPRWAFLVFAFFVLPAVINIAVNEFGAETAPSIALEAPSRVRRPLDGVFVLAETASSFPIAVIVENMIDARPTSGVARANLVWEAPTEAGITRFLAIYADGAEVPVIGPVRSARPYYVDWAEEVGALFAHVGGSPEALSLIESRDRVVDLNQFWHDESFWRADDRRAPHNVYTATKRLVSALAARKLTTPPVYGVWKYKEDESFDDRPDTHEFSVDFSTPAYAVSWKYHRTTNEYLRWQLGTPYRDIDGTEARAKNVVALATDIVVTDEVGRRRIRTIGEGPARIFRDGMAIEGIWKRPRLDARTRFYDRDGNEIAMNAGT